MQNLAQAMKIGIFRPAKNGKCFNLKIETFREGCLDHLLSIDLKILFKFKAKVVRNGP